LDENDKVVHRLLTSDAFKKMVTDIGIDLSNKKDN